MAIEQFDFRKEEGINNIVWTASDFSAEAAKEFPFIEMVEYEQEFSATLSNINYWARRIAGDAKDAYAGLYLGSATGGVYKLPFFMDQHHSISQAWEENTAPLGPTIQKIPNFVETVSKTFFPAAGIIYPKVYAGANEFAYDVRFTLLNTIDAMSVINNKKFLEQFISQNLHAQHNALTISPPCLYEVYVPGVRWSPVAVVSNLTVTNKGTLNRIPDIANGNYIFPDAWEVHIQIRELINESRNIYAEAIVGKGSGEDMTVRVIDTAAAAELNAILESASDIDVTGIGGFNGETGVA